MECLARYLIGSLVVRSSRRAPPSRNFCIGPIYYCLFPVPSQTPSSLHMGHGPRFIIQEILTGTEKMPEDTYENHALRRVSKFCI